MADDAETTNRSDKNDDLFQPSIKKDVYYDPPPWNIGSQVYVAFFGGVIAVTAIAYLNAFRLHAGEKVARSFIAMGAVALVTATALSYFVADLATDGAQERSYVRLASRAVAIALHFVFAAQMKNADRRFQLANRDYESLWRPGIGAVAVGGIIQAIILAVVVGTS